MNPRRALEFLVSGLLSILACGEATFGGVDTSDPNLETSAAPYDWSTMTFNGPALSIVLSQVQHEFFTGVTFYSSGEHHHSVATLEGMISVNGSPSQSTNASGNIDTVAFGKGPGNTTGTFQTEMLAMSLNGNSPFGPYMLRESPTLPSLGQTSISDIGGGLYRIDSFFDVFTELSIDGGATWIPSVSASHVVLSPEPGSLILFGLGVFALSGVTRRR